MNRFAILTLGLLLTTSLSCGTAGPSGSAPTSDGPPLWNRLPADVGGFIEARFDGIMGVADRTLLLDQLGATGQWVPPGWAYRVARMVAFIGPESGRAAKCRNAVQHAVGVFEKQLPGSGKSVDKPLSDSCLSADGVADCLSRAQSVPQIAQCGVEASRNPNPARTKYAVIVAGDFDAQVALHSFVWTVGKGKSPSRDRLDAGSFSVRVLGPGVLVFGEVSQVLAAAKAWSGQTPNLPAAPAYAKALATLDTSAPLLAASVGDLPGSVMPKLKSATVTVAFKEGTQVRGVFAGGLEGSTLQKRLHADGGLVLAALSAFAGTQDPSMKTLLETMERLLSSMTVSNVGDTIRIEASAPGHLVKQVTAAARANASSAFARFSSRAQTTEAIDNIDKLTKGAAFYFMAPKADPEKPDEILPCMFPASVPCTPEGTACEDGKPKPFDSVDRSTWDDPSWAALAFEMTDPHRYRYCFENHGTTATIKAIGDLDCDGVTSIYSRTITGKQGPPGECDVSAGPLVKTRPLE